MLVALRNHPVEVKLLMDTKRRMERKPRMAIKLLVEAKHPMATKLLVEAKRLMEKKHLVEMSLLLLSLLSSTDLSFLPISSSDLTDPHLLFNLLRIR
jgi:hypothetical protein